MARYRPEIDGLRAVAVVPVILFHAGLEPFGGGFVGVDVFFVISGYLITAIIVDDLDGGRAQGLQESLGQVRRQLSANGVGTMEPENDLSVRGRLFGQTGVNAFHDLGCVPFTE